MAKKPTKPETQAVLTRIPKEIFEQLRAEALAARRSIGSQAAVILEQRYAKQEVSA